MANKRSNSSIAKKMNAAKREFMMQANTQTRIVNSKKNDTKRSRKQWKQEQFQQGE